MPAINVNSGYEFLECPLTQESTSSRVDELPIHIVSSHGSYVVNADCKIETNEMTSVKIRGDSIRLGQNQFVIDVPQLGYTISSGSGTKWAAYITENRETWIRDFFSNSDQSLSIPTSSKFGARICAGPGCWILNKRLELTGESIGSGIVTIPKGMVPRNRQHDIGRILSSEPGDKVPASHFDVDWSNINTLRELLATGVSGIYLLHSCSPIELRVNNIITTSDLIRSHREGLKHFECISENEWKLFPERGVQLDDNASLFGSDLNLKKIKEAIMRHIMRKRSKQFSQFRSLFVKEDMNGATTRGEGTQDISERMPVTNLLQWSRPTKKQKRPRETHFQTLIEKIIHTFIGITQGNINIPHYVPSDLSGTVLPRFKIPWWSTMQIQTLQIYCTQLKTIPRDTIDTCPNLSFLQITASIDTLPSTGFSNLSHLKLVCPSFNVMPICMQKLKIFDLECSSEDAIVPPKDFDKLTTIEELFFTFPNATKIGSGVIGANLRSLTLVLPELTSFPGDFFQSWNNSYKLSDISLSCDSLEHFPEANVKDVILDSLYIDCKSALVTEWPPIKHLSVGPVFQGRYLPLYLMKPELISVNITNTHIYQLINIPGDTHLTIHETSMQTLQVYFVGKIDFTRVKVILIKVAMELSDLGNLDKCPRALDLDIILAPELSEINIRTFLTRRKQFLSEHLPTVTRASTSVHVKDKIYIHDVSWDYDRDARNDSNRSQVTLSEWPSMQKTNRLLSN